MSFFLPRIMTSFFVSMKVKNELVGNLRNFRRKMTNIKVLLILLLLPAAAFLLPGAAESGSGQSLVEWEILSKLNYSSQIRLHPHLLLLVTVPWSGESRSLMNELADVVAHDQGIFGSLKLMVLYRSSERMLADAVGADEGITIFYYHHSHPHKYLGRLRVQNILSSLHYVMSLLPEQFPFKILKTPEDIEIFLGSTDKALILSEFCGWTQKLLAKGGSNNSEHGFGFHEQFNGTIAAKENENQGLENANMDCGVDNRFSDMPWLSEFTSANNSAFLAAENMSLNSGASCKIDEFQHFESFLSKFLTVARDLFLPPERLRFGLVLDKALLSSLNIKDSGSWLVTLHFAGCPSCLKVLREGDDLKAFAKIQAWPVAELEDDVDDLENALPANKPSVVLFIDRSSDSLKIREKSRKALDSFREFALKIQMSNEMSEPKAFRLQKTSLKAFQASRSTSKHPKVGLLSASQKINIKDKMSIVVLNQGKQVILEDLVSGLQGSTLHEVLAYSLQQKKEVKLSSLAKDARFQLLSEDFDIKTVQALPGQTEVQSNKASELLVEGVSEGIIDPDRKAKLHEDAILGKQYNEQSESNKVKPSHVCQKDAETILVHTEVQSDELCPLEGALVRPIDSGKDQMPHVEEGKHIEQIKPVNTELQNDEKNLLEDESSQKSVNFGHDGMLEVATSPNAEETVEKLDEQNEKRNFRSSFFFLDGHYRRLRALTSGSNIPSVVLIDPTSQQHYVLSEQTDFSCTLLSEFLDGFLNGSLHPYQQSEHVVPTIRDAPIPPFVNLDFHEADSIPRVTVHMFNELVFYNQPDSKNAGNSRDKDVLVLFSNSWCGFCQRMELVVREVYRAIKGYTKTLRNGFKNEKLSLNRDEASNANLKFPMIYLMDCTLNDCSPILKSAVQRELYPSLLLFPAGRKKAIPYGGDIVVSNIINFLAHHGGHFYDLLQEKGILWSEGEPGINHNMNAEAPPFKNLPHEIILQEGPPTLDVQFSQNRAPLSSSAKISPHVIVGSILVATEKLLNVHPFDGSKVLVVKVNQSTGFQGLIVNKHISWDSLDELEDNLQLLKEAPLSFGGPIMKRGMPLVSLSRKYIVNQSMEVLPNVYFLDHRATISIIEELRLGNQSIHDFWFFLGFSSWGWGQLFDEISEGAWIVRNYDEEQIDGAWR